MKILIMGASCAGSTTLGNALAQRLKYTYLDTDAYFFEPSDIPYAVKRPLEERTRLLRAAFDAEENVIVGGSLVSWGLEWLAMFDLVVFLYLPHAVRMKRLYNREVERYGDKIFTDPYRAAQYKQFTAWANGYDDNSTDGRNLGVHQVWLGKLNCPLLKIEGDTTIKDRVERVLEKINSLSSPYNPDFVAMI